jgi:hypothetical protein
MIGAPARTRFFDRRRPAVRPQPPATLPHDRRSLAAPARGRHSSHGELCAGGLPLSGADSADDDAKPVGATTAAERQVDQWHAAMSAGHQGRQVKPDGMLASVAPG